MKDTTNPLNSRRHIGAQNHILAILLIHLFLLPLQQALGQCGNKPPQQISLGGNLNGLCDWNRDRPFNDVFKMNRGFSSDPAIPWSVNVPLTDSLGWPLQDFGVIVMVDMDSSMGGSYQILFHGQATLSPVASGFNVQNMVYDAPSNTSTADLVYPNNISNGQQMMLSFTNTQYANGVAGVKNIRILKPGIAPNGPTFDQRFLNHISRFSNLRFMDWHATNANTDSLWSDRCLLTSTTQTGNQGVAWEYCIELANTAQKDLWINIPHKATDGYISQLANLLKSTLDTGLHVYVEYSNEVWNWGFQQSHWNLAQAKAEAIQPGNPLNYDQANDQYTWNYRRIAKRGKEISDIFKTVFGPAEINRHIRVVYAVQVAWFDVGQRGIEFINTYYGPPQQYFYGLAVAPYFNSAAIDTSNTASKNEVLQALQNDVNNIFSKYDNTLMQYAAATSYYGLKFLCYEGGPDTFGPNNIQAKKEANEDPMMKTICKDYLSKWYGFGAESLMNWFTAGAGNWGTPYGSWPLTQHFENSVKLQALDELLGAAPPPLSAGFPVPGNIDARLFSGYSAQWNAQAHLQPVGWHPYDDYLIRVPQGSAGQYGITLGLASIAGGQYFDVYIDNQLLQNIGVPVTGSTSIFQSSSESLADLSEGLHTIRLKWNTSNYLIDSIKLTLKAPCIPLTTKALASDEAFSMYPNPVHEKLWIQSTQEEEIDMQIWNTLGACVHEGKVRNFPADIDTRSWPAGMYMVHLISSHRSEMHKLIKP